jgi:urease accessory protein
MKLAARVILPATFAMAATPAFAHIDPGENGSFLAGFSHPLFGLDHILAMIAVGLWAAMIGKRAVWMVPATFVGTMILGFALALGGVPLPFVEPAILASVVVLGLLIASAVNTPTAAGAALVAAFALFHGHAHGGELGVASALPYMLGFVAATTVLHTTGIGFGLALGSSVGFGGRETGRAIARGAGALCAAAGIGLIAGVI